MKRAAYNNSLPPSVVPELKVLSFNLGSGTPRMGPLRCFPRNSAAAGGDAGGLHIDLGIELDSDVAIELQLGRFKFGIQRLKVAESGRRPSGAAS